MAVEFAEVTLLDRGENRDDDGEKTMLQVVITEREDVQDVELINQPGEDSAPLNGTMVLILEIDPAFKVAIAADDGIDKTAEQGEREIYSSKLDELGENAEKLSILKLDKDGNIDLQSDALIKLNGEARDASGVGHEIKVNDSTDEIFVSWIALVTGAINAAAPGSITTAQTPIDVTGAITTGTDKVKLP
jgi:phage gp45-like